MQPIWIFRIYIIYIRLNFSASQNSAPKKTWRKAACTHHWQLFETVPLRLPLPLLNMHGKIVSYQIFTINLRIKFLFSTQIWQPFIRNQMILKHLLNHRCITWTILQRLYLLGSNKNLSLIFLQFFKWYFCIIFFYFSCCLAGCSYFML